MTIDGTEVALRATDGAFRAGTFQRATVAVFEKAGGKWQRPQDPAPGLLKKHGLQGPIDDAFMDSFVMVKPGGRPMNSATAEWAEKEMKHAVAHWRSQFRGDAVVKGDGEVTKDDIANSNLILWGDPMSNAYIGKIADKLPKIGRAHV